MIDLSVWVIDRHATVGCFERVGDARRLADAMGQRVGVLLVPDGAIHTDSEKQLIQRGADFVISAQPSSTDALPNDSGQANCSTALRSLTANARISTTFRAWNHVPVRTVFAGGDPASREWAALLAAKAQWRMIGPALMVEFRQGNRVVTHLHHDGRQTRQIEIPEEDIVVLTMNQGVAEACTPEMDRSGKTVTILIEDEEYQESQLVPSDPTTADIRDVNRLLAGGRGLGSREGFDLLREVADCLDAGIAASRMAVDLGWIEYERQVGQTGKTVTPDLYIACGISGASHHLQGMFESSHIIAINTDAQAPMMKAAHLALQADLHSVLALVKQRLTA